MTAGYGRITAYPDINRPKGSNELMTRILVIVPKAASLKPGQVPLNHGLGGEKWGWD